MDKIIITDLQATGIIGVKHPERDKPQILLINLTLYRDLRTAGESDNILDTINYSTISKAVAAQVSQTQFHTVEALASHLSRFLLQNYPLEAVRIRVEKPKKFPIQPALASKFSAAKAVFKSSPQRQSDLKIPCALRAGSEKRPALLMWSWTLLVF